MIGHLIAACVAALVVAGLMGVELRLPAGMTAANAIWLVVLPFGYVVGYLLLRDPE